MNVFQNDGNIFNFESFKRKMTIFEFPPYDGFTLKKLPFLIFKAIYTSVK